MKFLYLDETGTDGQSANVVIAGLCIDGYRLNTATEEIESLYQSIRQCYQDAHPKNRSVANVKTHKLIEGDGGWSNVSVSKRNDFLKNVCKTAAGKGTIFTNAVCIETFREAKAKSPEIPLSDDWQAAAMFLVGLAQKLGQKHKLKGKTELIIDEALQKVPPLRIRIHESNDWFVGLYNKQETIHGRKIWRQPKNYSGLDQIINKGLSVKSEHSALIQIADTIAKIYSFNLDLDCGKKEDWSGQKQLFQECVRILDAKRTFFPKHKFDPNSECIKFYQQVKPTKWTL